MEKLTFRDENKELFSSATRAQLIERLAYYEEQEREQNFAALEIGTEFDWKGYTWIKLDNIDGGTLAIMKELWKEKIPFDKDRNGNWAKSSLRERMQKELLPQLGEENLIPHVVDLVADNGDDTFGKIEEKVFLLTCDEIRKYRKVLPKYKNWSWTCTPWYIDEDGNAYNVRVVNTSGALHYSNAINGHGAAAACVIR